MGLSLPDCVWLESLNFHCEHHHNTDTQAHCGVCIMRFDSITNTDANIYVIRNYEFGMNVVFAFPRFVPRL